MAVEVEKKSKPNFFKKLYHAIIIKKNKNVVREDTKTVSVVNKETPKPIEKKLLEHFENLKLENFRNKENEKALEKKEDEVKTKSIKLIENDRLETQYSSDSGISEESSSKSNDELNELKCFQILRIEDEESSDSEQKTKEKKTVFVSRGPIRNKFAVSTNCIYPYATDPNDICYEQINKKTHSGGQVKVNSIPPAAEIGLEINQVSPEIDQSEEKVHINDLMKTTNLYAEQNPITELDIENMILLLNSENNANHIPENIGDPIFNYSENNEEGIINLTLPEEKDLFCSSNLSSTYPTPPRSEGLYSPYSDPVQSFCYRNGYISPEESSPIYSTDKCQENEQFEHNSGNEKSPKLVRKKKDSSPFKTLKQYKDMQKSTEAGFSKKECCKSSRSPCKQLFQQFFDKLPSEQQKLISLGVAKKDLKDCFSVMKIILRNLSEHCEERESNLFLFSVICDRLVAQMPAVFISDLGLQLLRCSVMWCYKLPLLTRCLVDCIRVALRLRNESDNPKPVFEHVNHLGDTLVIECARAGDDYADVLAEILHSEPDQRPLFDINMTNNEGYTALHVACSWNRTDPDNMHTVHVLLKHGKADLWKGDIKGGDTPLHLAINSSNCQLELVLLLFSQIGREQWGHLAKVQNRSSISPLEYAKAASKSTTRHDFPLEVLDFMKKCRTPKKENK